LLQPGKKFSNNEDNARPMMKIDLNDPIAVLLVTFQILERAGIETALYGGLALAVYGELRETKDADLAVAGARSAEAEAALRAAGLNVLRAFEQMRFGGQYVSRLTLFGGLGGSLNTVDLVQPRSDRYGRDVFVRAVMAELRDQQVRVVSPEDFVILKLLATRDRDVEDAASVVRSLSHDLDFDLIGKEVATLGEEIEDHDVSQRWARVRAGS
jgi:hypothetical protein